MIERYNQDLNNIDTSILPPPVKRLIKIIGIPDTLKLLTERGGAPFQFPKKPHLAIVLPQIISRESVIAICQSDLAGEWLRLPKKDKITKQLRNNYIRAQKGLKTKRKLSQEVDLTTRQIETIWNTKVDEEPVLTASNSVDDRQMRLF